MNRKSECLHCGTPYVARRAWSEYCSKKCRWESANRRKKDAKVLSSCDEIKMVDVRWE